MDGRSRPARPRSKLVIKPATRMCALLIWSSQPWVTVPAAGCPPAAQKSVSAQASPTKPLQSAPAFSVRDISGKVHSQTEISGRGGVLFFFCGCQPCHEAAKLWSQIQRGGALPVDAAGKPSSTLIFFFGEKDAARTFVQQTGLDPGLTGMVADPKMLVGRKFGVETCPRAFVVEASGKIGYTNTRKDDRAEGGSVTIIVSRVVQAVRDAKKEPPDAAPAADIETPGTPRSDLVPVASRGDRVVARGHLLRRLGEFHREKSRPIEQLFVLQNGGTEPVTIDGLVGSCGCTDMRLYAGDRRARTGAKLRSAEPQFPEGDAKQSLTLAPGARATLRVKLSFGEVEAGRHQKYLWVMEPGRDTPAATVCLDFVVRTGVTASTRRVEFGRLKAGETRTVPFKVTIARASYSASRPPVLRSTNPHVTVKPARAGVPTSVHGKAAYEVPYEVTLSPNATLGTIAGTLILHPPGWRNGGEASGAARPSPKVIAALGGEVIGDVRALPGTLVFGTVGKGRKHGQRATLLLAREELRGSIRVVTSAPWLKATVVPPLDGGSDGKPSVLGSYAHLDVAITPDAPLGALSGTVTLTTPAGQRLIVPVVGTVQ
jgi:hypothetical protein